MARAETRLELHLVEEAGDWGDIDPAPYLGALAPAIAAREPRAAGSASVVLADDAFVRDLNRRFRGLDKPTNVLSFPDGEDGHLGDVVLAAGTLANEAAAAGRPLGHHFAHLVAHGILHLAGHDHHDDREAEVMETLETAILADLAIPDPYAHDLHEEATT